MPSMYVSSVPTFSLKTKKYMGLVARKPVYGVRRTPSASNEVSVCIYGLELVKLCFGYFGLIVVFESFEPP